jgi:hypothetical protein
LPYLKLGKLIFPMPGISMDFALAVIAINARYIISQKTGLSR